MTASSRKNHQELSRQCIVTRQSLDKDELVRFVLDPESRVVPDLACKLPGRGVWVSCSPEILAQAVAKKQFAAAFKQAVTVRPDLQSLVVSLLREKALSALSFARKAGLTRVGFEKVLTAVRSEEAIALLHASDASSDGINKLRPETQIPVFCGFTRDELSTILGGDNVVHAAVCGGTAGKDFLLQLRRFSGFVGESPL